MNPAVFLALALAAGCAVVLYARSRTLATDGGAAAPDPLAAAPEWIKDVVGDALDTEDSDPVLVFTFNSDPWGVREASPGTAADADAGSVSYDVFPDTDAVYTLFDVDAMRKKFSLPATAAPYVPTIEQTEKAHGLPAGLLARLLYQESRFRPEVISGQVRSPVGAIGIAQFMPATARDEGLNPLDPFASINKAGAYLKKLYNATGSWSQALAAYNWGIGNVLRKGLGAAPTETKNYVAEISADVNLPS